MSNQVWSNSTHQYPYDGDILTTNITAVNTFSQGLGCNTLYVNNPTLDDTRTTSLIYNHDTSFVEYCDNMLTTNLSQTISNKNITDSTCVFTGNADATKQLQFSLTGNTTGKVLTIETNQSNSAALTIPDLAISGDTIATLKQNQTFTGSNVFSGTITNILSTNQITFQPGGTGNVLTLNVAQPAGSSRVLTFPDPGAAANVVYDVTAQTLTNKKLNTLNCALIDNADNTKQIGFACSSNTTGTTLTIASQQSTSQTLSCPNLSSGDTIATLSSSNVFTGANTMKFQTTGGTPAIMDFYEILSQTITFSGAFSLATTAKVVLVRSGTMVTMYVAGFSGAQGSAATISAPSNTIPSRFMPGSVTSGIQSPIKPGGALATDNGTNVSCRVDINVSGTGNIVIYSGVGSNFSGTGTLTFFDFSIVWIV